MAELARAEDIAFLEAVRAAIVEILFLGYSPSMPFRDFDNEDQLRVAAWRKNPTNEALRVWFLQSRARADKLLIETGNDLVISQPAPFNRGPARKAGVLELVTGNFTLYDIQLATFTDVIDQAIGSLQLERMETTRLPTPELEIRHGSVFVAMAMDDGHPELADVLDAIKRAAQSNNMAAERIDDQQTNEAITPRILDGIRSAEQVVADLTHERPNVYFEAGYAAGLGKVPVYIARRGAAVHFDLKDFPVIGFANLRELEIQLTARLSSLRGTAST